MNNDNNRDKTNQQHYESIYKQGQEFLRYPDEILVSYLFTTLKKDSSIKNVLDVGCGSGRHVVLFAREGYIVSGTETAPSALEYAKEYTASENLNASFKLGSVSHIEFKDNSFDLLLCWGVINNVIEKNAFERSMREIKRVLKPDGKLLISLMSQDDKKFKEAVCVEDNLYKISYKDSEYYTRFWDRGEVVSFLKKYGFEIEKLGFVLRNVNFDENIPVSYYTVAAKNIK